MNEAETCAELIDPKLKACGWGVGEGVARAKQYAEKLTTEKAIAV